MNWSRQSGLYWKTGRTSFYWSPSRPIERKPRTCSVQCPPPSREFVSSPSLIPTSAAKWLVLSQKFGRQSPCSPMTTWVGRALSCLGFWPRSKRMSAMVVLLLANVCVVRLPRLSRSVSTTSSGLCTWSDGTLIVHLQRISMVAFLACLDAALPIGPRSFKMKCLLTPSLTRNGGLVNTNWTRTMTTSSLVGWFLTAGKRSCSTILRPKSKPLSKTTPSSWSSVHGGREATGAVTWPACFMKSTFGSKYFLFYFFLSDLRRPRFFLGDPCTGRGNYFPTSFFFSSVLQWMDTTRLSLDQTVLIENSWSRPNHREVGRRGRCSWRLSHFWRGT